MGRPSFTHDSPPAPPALFWDTSWHLEKQEWGWEAHRP